MEVVKQYIIIQNYRYTGRFSFTCECDPALLNTYIPKNILQPIIENSILHGICPRMEPRKYQPYPSIGGARTWRS